MAGLKPESLSWVDQMETLRALGPNASRADRKEALNVKESQITILNNLDDCFDPAAIEKVRQAAQANPPYILSSNSARALVWLKKNKVADLHGSVHAALDVILAHRLDTRHIKALVDWILSGKPAAEFNPETKPTAPSSKSPTAKAIGDLAGSSPNAIDPQLAKLFKQVEESTGEDKIKAQAKLVAYVAGQSAEGKEDSSAKPARGKKSSQSGEPSLFWEWMLGVKFMSQLKAKAKKGELTTHEKLLILADKGLVKPLGWVFGNFGKLFKKMAIGLWHSVEEAAGKTVKKILAVVLPLLFIIAIVWAVLAFFHFAVISPLHWIEAKVKSGFHWGGKSDEQPASSAPTPPPAVSSILPVQAVIHKVPQKKTEKPVMAYQPSIAFNTSDLSPTGGSTSPINNGDKPATTLYDPKLLEQEIAALPKNCVVKAFPVLTDEGMPGDLAVSRMQGVTDPDKYTMKIGSGTEKIISINTTTTNLTINYKSTDPFNLDSAGPLNFFWEDVLYIHTDEIEVEGKTPYKFYQLSLVVSGSKVALTIQCASTDDLKHLVSTMEYFIRNSRLGHDTALAGMPYPTQGVRLTNGCLVNWLWADSPMAKAGVKLGDMVWSVEKNAGLPPEREKLEAQLGALTSGPHDLFLVSPADREKGLVLMNQTHTNNFNPKRHKVLLTL